MHRILALMEESIGRDVQFVHRFPTAFFQCMWNICWWHDCSEARFQFCKSKGPWDEDSHPKLFRVMERWRRAKEAGQPEFMWVFLRSNHEAAFVL